MAAGNYAFLNVLMALPCVALLDDALLSRFLPSPRHVSSAPQPANWAAGTGCWSLLVLAGLLLLSIQGLCWIGASDNDQLGKCLQWHPAAFWQLGQSVGLGNTYTSGRFASITSERYEMVLWAKHSTTGMWAELDIPCKVGSVDRPPCFTAPYHRRLAWQFWFLGLGSSRKWFDTFVLKLMDGDPGAWAAIEASEHSFSSSNLPTALEAHAYLYKMAPAVVADSGRTGWRSEPDTSENVVGSWWNRTYAGSWMEPMYRN